MLSRKLLLIASLFVSLAALADGLSDDPGALFADGVRLFEAEAYAQAASTFDQAFKVDPANDEYVYWRGKAYGRQAEKAGWLNAIKFAKLTRESFERAVRLNSNNAPAVADLARYYTEAPSFLGGDKAKAESLRAHLKTLSTAPSETPDSP
jgi:tetratricopeptide (TPR) repeat protein